MSDPTDFNFFQTRLNQTFQVDVENGSRLPLKLTGLVQRTDLPSPTMEHFTVTFQGPPSQCLPQQIYELTPSGSEPISVFIVPVHGDAEGFYYEAVFNRNKAS